MEYAAAENFTIDFTLLYLSFMTLKLKPKKRLIALSSLAGTLFAIVFPLFKLNGAISVILKLLAGALMAVISLKTGSFKRYLSVTLVFYAYTFLLGGALFSLYFFFGTELIGENYLISRLPVGAVLCGAALLFFFVHILIRVVYARVKLSKTLCDCDISYGGNTLRVKALMDSGNLLTVNGRAVSLISLASALSLSEELLFKANECAEVNTVSGKSKILLFQADEIKIYLGDKVNRIEGAVLGISRGLHSGDYSLILNSEYIGE